ncbi:MAG: thiamine phosphate synthase [Gammaproteobacteria bacterium]|nr:thiamine phosphate synthase [Gammaproteobacteria bacterium]
MNARSLRLCLITNLQDQSFSLYQSLILKAIRGGITSVQLREKNKNLFELKQLALQLKAILYPFKIPLIINDHVEMAKSVNAEGVHLGQSDYSPHEARKILGSTKIIGWSVETLTDLEIANQLTCIDYIAASSVFFSKTKPECKTIWGISGLKKITKISIYPVIAIGGINSSNIQMIMESGACGVAVMSAIHTLDPYQAAADLIGTIDHSIDKKSTECLNG